MPRLVLCVALMAIWSMSLAAASVSAPVAQQDCSSAITVLLPCLGFVQGTDMNPSKSCCKGLSSLVKSSPVCLCQLSSSGASTEYGINATLALQLPSKCDLKNVDPSQCSAFSSGAPSPAPAPPTKGHHPKGVPSLSPSPEALEPVPAPVAGGESPFFGSSSDGTSGFGAPLNSPTPAPSSAAKFSPIFWIYLTWTAICMLF